MQVTHVPFCREKATCTNYPKTTNPKTPNNLNVFKRLMAKSSMVESTAAWTFPAV